MLFKKKQPDTLKQYTDPTGEFTNRELKSAEWYARHKEHLRKLLIWSLSIWCVLSIGFGLWKWSEYLIVGLRQDQVMQINLLNEFANYSAIQSLYGAQDLNVFSTRVFPSATGRYDFFSDVVNPNDRWIATVTYQYQYGGGETEIVETTLLPGDRRTIVVFGQATNSSPRNPRLVILNTTWKHISAHDIKDVEEFVQDRRNITWSDVDFTRASATTGAVSHMLSFTLKNNSPYSLWQSTFVVELFNGNSPVGVLLFTEDQFLAGEERLVALHSTQNNFRVTDIRVYPLVNVFDETVFMRPEDV